MHKYRLLVLCLAVGANAQNSDGTYGAAVNNTLSRLTNGWLVNRPDESSTQVKVFDPNGRAVAVANVTFPGAQRVKVIAQAVTPSGSVLASGYAVSDTGQLAYFVSKFGADGRPQATVRTNPFVPAKLCSNDEDSVWVAGLDLGKENAGRRDYDVLRLYSFQSGQTVSLLSRSSFSGSLAPVMAGFGSFLECTPTSVVLYSSVAKELMSHRTADPGSVSRSRLQEPWPDRSLMTGLAVTASGAAYASFASTDAGLPKAGLFRLDLRVGKTPGWVPVRVFHQNASVDSGWLLGADGNRLLELRATEPGAIWVEPAK